MTVTGAPRASTPRPRRLASRSSGRRCRRGPGRHGAAGAAAESSRPRLGALHGRIRRSARRADRRVQARGGRRGRVLRLVETRGGRGEVPLRWNGAAASVVATDLLERPLANGAPLGPADLRHDRRAAVTSFRMRPFQIVTLLVRET